MSVSTDGQICYGILLEEDIPLPAENASLKWNVILTDFCKKYSLEYEGVPQWYLSSYWG